MKIMIPFEIKEEFISDVLSTAFNGGSNYWIEDIKNLSESPKSYYFSKSVAQGDTLEIIDNEDYKVHKLDKNIFAEGYKRYAEFCLKKGIQVYSDPCDIDSQVADMILQFAIFNELIFG